MTEPGRTVVIGVGNDFRGDDGAGPAVLARLAGVVPAGVHLVASDGEPANLLMAWDGASLAIVVDAVQAGPAPPGTLHRAVIAAPDALPGSAAVPEDASITGSHQLGVGSAIGLAQVLGRLPARLIVHGIQGGDFTLGASLSQPVADAIDDLVAAVIADLAG
ncbi:MAG TPA: hydrogenase maturation protease [Streptosporangiaceae bacterium]|nr:hydrogenase maturation protease [Streptosporangiaceae bacterium]